MNQPGRKLAAGQRGKRSRWTGALTVAVDGRDGRIFIVEDDDKVAELLQSLLNRFGFQVIRPTDYHSIDDQIEISEPDLIILDINLPKYDGFYWCRVIRRFTKAPILYMTARNSDMDQVHALEAGGDDYVTKPFQPDVVLAKIRALLRRAYGEYMADHEAEKNDRIYLGPLMLDIRKSCVSYQGATEVLSKTETQLLRQLMESRGLVVERNQLLATLWDDIEFVDDNTLTVNVARVRRKLESMGLPEAIVTVRGIGYRIQLGEASS